MYCSTKDNRYSVWCGIKQRCFNPNEPHYSAYGGRGITMCEQWRYAKGGFQKFCEDMGPRPSLDYVIDRIDNDGNYEPANCRWITKYESYRHKSPTHHVRKKERPLKPHQRLNILLALGMRFCRVCEILQPLSNFSLRNNSSTGTSSWCKPCVRNIQKDKRKACIY